MTSTVQYRKDSIGQQYYASRNFNEIQHSFQTAGANKSGVDWFVQLRQKRTKLNLRGSASAPELQTTVLSENRQREPLAPEHGDGPYHCERETVGAYQNFAHTVHLFQNNGPRASGSGSSAHCLDWHMNLRNGLHEEEFKKTLWKRHCTKPHQSFDMMNEYCSRTSSEYLKAHTTPLNRRPDRASSALPTVTIRDDKISLKRWEGCEGTNVGQWRHLVEDRSRGAKTRKAIQAEVTMRKGRPTEKFHAITDNRSDACLVEMLGKKRWHGAVSHDPLGRRPPEGDPKLHYFSNMVALSEDIPEYREMRKSKHPRADAGFTEEHQGRRREEKKRGNGDSSPGKNAAFGESGPGAGGGGEGEAA
jgi:hypothetical protein